MLIVHAASGVLGFYLLYLTFAMRESTEGKWVNRLEELWIQIDEHSRTVGETTRALFGRLAGMVTTLFNRILGRRMISVRVVGISGSLSFASLFFVCGLALEFLVYLVVNYSRVSKNPDASIIALIPKIPIVAWGGLVFLLAAGFFLALAAFPILFRSPVWAWISCFPTAFWLFGTYRMFQSRIAYENQLAICLALSISLASDLLMLVLIRQSLRWLVAGTSITKMIIAIAIQGLALCLIFLTPFQISLVWRPDLIKGSLGLSLFVLAIFNIPTVIASAAFDVSLLAVLLHRISWPLLSQWTYVLTRNDVLEKRKTMRVIGVAFLAYGLSGHSGALWKIVEEILK